MNPKERMKAVLLRLAELQKIETRSDAEEGEIDQLLAEVNDLGPKIIRQDALDAAAKRSAEFTEPVQRRATQQPSEGAEALAKIDRRSLGQRFMESDSVKNYQQGQKRSQPFEVGSFYARHQIQHSADTSPEELRTLIYTGALSADMISPQLVPGFFRGDDLQGASVRDVLINGQTTSDAIIFFRELLFTNAAAGVAQATATTGSSGLKPESALTFEQDTAPVVTIAHWIPITRQTLQDAAQLQTYVEQRLIDGLKLEEADQLLNGTGTADLVGILQTSNVQALDAAYFAANPVANANEPQENFNRVFRGKTKIRSTGRAKASFAVLNPTDLENMITMGNQTGNYYGAGPFGNGTNNTSLWGLRLVEDENIAAGTALVGDGRMAAVWDRMQAQIFIGTIDDQFVRNMLTILAEERLGLTVFRPTAFAKVTLAAWA
jgi:hypothetical protein